jgi:hypothetical protein
MENTNKGEGLPKGKSKIHRNGNPDKPSGLKETRNTGKHNAGTTYIRKAQNQVGDNS